MKALHSWIVLALLMGSALQASAVRLSAKAPAAAAVTRPAASASSPTSADDSSSMREGVITAVSAKHDEIEVNGSWLKLPERVHVFKGGVKITQAALATGQRIRFVLVAGTAAADRTTLRAVYVL